MEKDLVSIISPCFNGEKFLETFLNSVLEQTYPYIEFIIIDDGSTDNTKKIILSYEEKFKDKKIDFKYIYEKNAGQAAAVNKGLKIFKGEYLMWVDSDDILKKDNVEEKVKFFKNNPQYDMVICKTEVLREEDYKRVKILERKRKIKKDKPDELFTDLITGKNVYYPPGGYMVTAKAFLESIPSRQIYESRGGQNWQLMLPIAYKFKCGYIDKILFSYVIRKGSHSRIGNKEETLLKRFDEHEKLLNIVINSINMKDKNEKMQYLNIVKEKYNKERMHTYFKNNNTNELRKIYEKTKREEKKMSIVEKTMYFSTINKTTRLISKILYILIRSIEKLKEYIQIYIN